MQLGIQNASINISFGKRKKKSQMNEIFTDDGRIPTIELEVSKGSMPDPERGAAFLLDEANQLVAEDGNWTQILGERSCLPLAIITRPKAEDIKGSKNDPLHQLINQIFHETHEDAKLRQYMEAMKNAVLDKLVQLVAIPAAAFVVIYALNWIKR